jgi:hypothetical protein
MPDMQFDETMRNRLLAFQRAHSLDADGVAGTEVWTKLVETASAPAQEASATEVPAEPVAERTAEPVVAQTALESGEPAPDLGPDAFPLLHALAACGDDPEKLQRFLEAELEIDLNEIERNMAAVLDGS